MASADIVTVAVFFAAIYLNKQAVIVLLAHLICELAYLLPLNDFWMTITGATIYAVTAAIFIKLSPNIRYALITISGIYYLNAIDFYLFDGYETLYYHSVSYLIGAVDLYVLWQLFKGVPQHARVGRVVHGRFVNL